ncbi:MAG: hypothetical protein COT73_02900 [Bdellovibrio sp. CG10_big_fil_rev_8_21_14_0_10_47_8]|nr:MAG: hypothetical protein COT73_02900 [Bdellovibrio sp. CG10_big_fil_rev_8_21_14_0_10_47_8]
MFWRHFNSTDKKIFAAALAAVFAMLYLLYDDSLILPGDNGSNLNSIGKISITSNDVRRKVSRQFVWRSAKSSDKVHLGDSLFTGKDSSAEIKLDDGRQLTVQENSLIVFNNVGNQLNLDLRFGQLNGTIDGCLKVNVQGESVDICGDKSKLEIKSDGSVNVQEGSAKLSSAKGSKEIKAEPPKELAWTPVPKPTHFHTHQERPLILSWQSFPGALKYRTRLSKEKDFQSLAMDTTSKRNGLQTRRYPESGEYFVQVEAENEHKQVIAISSIEKISFVKLEAPEIIAPADKTTLTFKVNADGELIKPIQVDVQWKTLKETASQYKVEVSSTADFTDVIAQTEVADLHWTTPSLAVGTYFVHVQEINEAAGKENPWSLPVEFTVDTDRPAKLPAPKLLTKEIEYLGPSEQPITMEWSPVSEAKNYVVEISSKEDFSQIEVSTETDKTQWSLPSYHPGRSFFRVHAKTAKGTLGQFSDTGDLTVKVKRPVLLPVEPTVIFGKTPEDPGDPQEVNVGWSDLQIVDSYLLEISEQKDFTDKVEVLSKAVETKVTLPKPGQFFWRVKGLGTDGKPVTRFSDVGQMDYILKVPLAQPILIEPDHQTTLFFQGNMNPYIWVSWKPVRQATGYLLEVATDEEFNQKVFSTTVSEARYLIKTKMPQGPLFWRVQAQGEDSKISHWSDTRQMIVWTGSSPSRHRVPANKGSH